MMLKALLLLGVLYSTAESACKSAETLTEEEIAVLDEHNRLRAQHQDTPPLCYGESGDDITFTAQSWSEKLVQTQVWMHSPAVDYGENLYVYYYMYMSQADFWVYCTDEWYSEIEWWNNDNVCKSTGHYTQVVWKDTRQLNCGYANNGWVAVTVCQYYPPGNVAGQYDDQVAPLAKVWRDDHRCGNNWLLPDGEPARCDAQSKDYPCCSANGWCGNSDDHCGAYRNDLRCGPEWHLAYGEPAECNPDGEYHCCNLNSGWCGNTELHCDCENCIDYS